MLGPHAKRYGMAFAFVITYSVDQMEKAFVEQMCLDLNLDISRETWPTALIVENGVVDRQSDGCSSSRKGL